MARNCTNIRGKAGAKGGRFGLQFVGDYSNNAPMNRKKTTDPVKAAQEEAEKDILRDPELSGGDPTDDLDEGELARRDNSDEEGFDQLEKKRPGRKGAAEK